MHWTKLFIPTLREDHPPLIRAGYMRGRDYLFLGNRALQKIAGIVRRELESIGAQEVSIEGSMHLVARELRGHRQLPQIWYQIEGSRMRSFSADLTDASAARISASLEKIIARCGIVPAAALEQFADPEGDFEPEEFHTPGQKSIADVSSFTGLAPTSQMKSLVVVAGDLPVLALVRGDHQLSQEKLAWYLDVPKIRPAQADEIRDWFNADAGSLGPIGANIRVIADEALRGRRNMICGANRNDYHLRHVTPGRHFNAEFCDIQESLEATLFRTRRSGSSSQVSNEAAQLVNVVDSTTELFLDRILQTAAEQHHDADGLALPPSIAPFTAVITPVNISDEAQRTTAIELHDSSPFDVLLDDRDERPGVKFKDADLIGIPYRVTLGKKLTQGLIELKNRRDKSSQDVHLSSVWTQVSEQIK